VFDGASGNYSEEDRVTANDLYGRTKYLGEVTYNHCLTIRTSIIGHELKGKYGLIEWFLSQSGQADGYVNAIYSGFPTVEMARIILEYVIPNEELFGLYHVSSNPISKHDLLQLVKQKYDKDIVINKYEDYFCNRALRSDKFKAKTGYRPPAWPDLVEGMHEQWMTFQSDRRSAE
jgi:dTDP-4-dehydrorhamnose reductase